MDTFSRCLGNIIALLYTIWIVGVNIVRLIIWVKCFKVKKCNNRKCFYLDAASTRSGLTKKTIKEYYK